MIKRTQTICLWQTKCTSLSLLPFDMYNQKKLILRLPFINVTHRTGMASRIRVLMLRDTLDNRATRNGRLSDEKWTTERWEKWTIDRLEKWTIERREMDDRATREMDDRAMREKTIEQWEMDDQATININMIHQRERAPGIDPLPPAVPLCSPPGVSSPWYWHRHLAWASSLQCPGSPATW